MVSFSEGDRESRRRRKAALTEEKGWYEPWLPSLEGEGLLVEGSRVRAAGSSELCPRGARARAQMPARKCSRPKISTHHPLGLPLIEPTLNRIQANSCLSFHQHLSLRYPLATGFVSSRSVSCNETCASSHGSWTAVLSTFFAVSFLLSLAAALPVLRPLPDLDYRPCATKDCAADSNGQPTSALVLLWAGVASGTGRMRFQQNPREWRYSPHVGSCLGSIVEPSAPSPTSTTASTANTQQNYGPSNSRWKLQILKTVR